MDIIKDGRSQEETCKQCKSVLNVAPTDVQADYTGQGYPEWYVCPVCQKRNNMQGRIPKSWVSIVYKDEPV